MATIDVSLDVEAALGLDGGSGSAARQGVPAFKFRAGPLPGNALEVISFRGREEVSKGYTFDVLLAASSAIDEASLEPALLGQPCSLVIEQSGYVRGFHGVVASYRVEGTRLRGDRWGLRVRLVPVLWLLRRRRNSRVFQNQRVDEIVTQILENYGIHRSWTLRKQYPVREYCVQYEETDYAFVTRLLAESGISYFFEQPPVDLDSLFGDVLGPLGAAAGVAGAVGSAIGGPVGGALGDIAGLVAQFLPRERMVFVDAPSGFPPMDRMPDGGGLGSFMGGLVSAAVEAGVGMANDALGSVLGGSPLGVNLRTQSPKLYHQVPDGSRGGEDSLSEFTLERVVRSKSAFFRAHDPVTPTIELTSRAGAQGGRNGRGSEPPTASLVSALQASVSVDAHGLRVGLDASLGRGAEFSPFLDPTKLEVFDHHYDYLTVKWRNDRAEAALMLQQLRRRAWIGRGASGCGRLEAGRRFTLDDHSRSELNQEYTLVAVEHHGEVPATSDAEGVSRDRAETPAYRNTFECIPADVPYCPKRPKRQTVQVAETATVVGPTSEEIHTNEHGHIKVQFHWDRYGMHNEHSSCWIRAVQPWTGPQWGVQFIPRVGTEVLVTFEGGDQDRPMVTGCVYHQAHPTPFRLPDDKTRSGIRTQSSPGGGGHNELSFEDATGNEQVYLRAERDLDELVHHDHTLKVGHDERIEVARNQDETVGGDRADHVTGDAKNTVEGDHTVRVLGDRDEEVAGGEVLSVLGDRSVSIGGAEKRAVLATAESIVEDDSSLKVRGNMLTLVGRADAKRSYYLHVEGQTTLVGMGVTEVVAEKQLVLRCGKSSIVLGPDHIELVAPTVHVSASGAGMKLGDSKIVFKSDAQTTLIADKLLAKSSGASLGLGSDAKLAGAKVKLSSSPESASDEVQNDTPKPTKISLVDKDGAPLPYQRFRVILDDGSERAGITDKDGRAELLIEGGAKIVFSELGKTEKK